MTKITYIRIPVENDEVGRYVLDTMFDNNYFSRPAYDKAIESLTDDKYPMKYVFKFPPNDSNCDTTLMDLIASLNDLKDTPIYITDDILGSSVIMKIEFPSDESLEDDEDDEDD